MVGAGMVVAEALTAAAVGEGRATLAYSLPLFTVVRGIGILRSPSISCYIRYKNTYFA
jgi:hypothetical protein